MNHRLVIVVLNLLHQWGSKEMMQENKQSAGIDHKKHSLQHKPPISSWCFDGFSENPNKIYRRGGGGGCKRSGGGGGGGGVGGGGKRCLLSHEIFLLVCCDLVFLCIGFKKVDLVSSYLAICDLYIIITLNFASRKL